MEPYEPYDYVGATNGSIVVNEAGGDLHFSSLDGVQVHNPVYLNDFYCRGNNPPPACSYVLNHDGGFGDQRLYYDDPAVALDHNLLR